METDVAQELELIVQRFDVLEAKMNQIIEESGTEFEILQQTVAGLLSAYAEVVVMIEGLIANVLYENDEEKIQAFYDTVEANRKNMMSVLNNELTKVP